MSEENKRDLRELIKALYPIIHVVTYEEKRVANIVQDILKEKGFDYTLKLWSQDMGLYTSEGKAVGSDNDGLEDPISLLEYIKKVPKTEKTVFVLKDYDAFLGDVLIQRHLRTIVEDGLIHVCIIILSPLINLPPRLLKSIQIIEWSLPTKEERDSIIKYDKKARAGKIEPDEWDKINRAMAGFTETECVNVIARQAARDKTKCVTVDLLNEEKMATVKKNPVLEIYQPGEDDRFDMLGGWDLAKEFIMKRKDCFSEEALNFGVEPPKGLLLFGVPGCGKSKFAKCMGYQYGLPVVILSLATVMAQSGGIVGQAENWLKEAFRTIEAIAPCVVFMDEIEKGASGMESSGQSDAGMTSRMLSVFLDKLENRNSPFFVIATANNVSQLSPEMVRPGRWDKIMFAGLPNTVEREKIISVHLDKRGFLSKHVDVKEIAKQTDTFTGAELEQITKDGIVEAFTKKGKVDTNLLLQTVKEMTPQSKFKGQRIQALIKWAEENGAKSVSSEESDGEVKVLQLVSSDDGKSKKS